jgi:hypothetical protein
MTNQGAKLAAHHRMVALGIYPSREPVEEALREFDLAGFPQADMSIVLSDGNATQAATPSGSLGWFTPFTDLAVPELGNLLVAGPLVGILTGSAASGVTGALSGTGLPEREANLYAEKLKHGAVLVSIHADSVSEANRARALLIQTGATDTASARGERV